MRNYEYRTSFSGQQFMKKRIIYSILTAVISLALIWQIVAFIAWDINWLSEISSWPEWKRGVFIAIVLGVLTIEGLFGAVIFGSGEGLGVVPPPPPELVKKVTDDKKGAGWE